AVGLFYEEEKDANLALSFYKKSCSLKDGKACYKLGSIYEKGELVRQNLTSSISFYMQSCSFGYAEACYLLGRYNQKEKKDMAKAKRYFGMACDKKHKEACEAYKEFVKQGIEIY
ncbi:MAG: sel1 repeat family protein, partial [Campylobacter sp.]|nr:sel1 repeat family protein [Campylobacter sp.]